MGRPRRQAHRAGAKVFRQPLIGEVTLPFQSLTVDAAGDQVLTVITPQPGSPEHDAIQLSASWNAHSPNPAEAGNPPNTRAAPPDVCAVHPVPRPARTENLHRGRALYRHRAHVRVHRASGFLVSDDTNSTHWSRRRNRPTGDECGSSPDGRNRDRTFEDPQVPGNTGGPEVSGARAPSARRRGGR
ncbi:hypothetical protein NUG22_14465 [Saccharothrix longispora]|nr:hypothetical protein [Saccharothrix longispora]MDU0290425.1 hypothetical protein [Saccharothrix longispora]